ncbi:MAG: glycosyltransferase [Alphaproteobacteria bacterium]|nr:glycosyltransferase [Alphaproteobacteria bacterium]
MIPKQIFYMWCGSEKPIDVEMSILSWHKNLPDYKIIEINEESEQYFDFSAMRRENEFFDFACRNRMWAYAADYVRCYVLEKFGGIWLDTDITVVKNFDKLLGDGLFFGRDTDGGNHVETAVIGAAAHHPVLRDILDFYQNEIWKSPLYTGPRIATEILQRHGFDMTKTGIVECEDIKVYPPEYFFPLALGADFSLKTLTAQTRTIHWWKASWGKKAVTDWLKSKHKKGKEKALTENLKSTLALYLFGFLRFAHYDTDNAKIYVCGLPLIKIIKRKNKQKALLFGFIPLLKWK